MTIERETLHRPLFDKMYEVYVPQYAAQQASGRFLPGEHLTQRIVTGKQIGRAHV